MRTKILLAALTVLALTASPAAAHALPAHEWMPADGPSHGVVITIHGGGWVGVGPEPTKYQRQFAPLYRNAGWTVLNVDYRPLRDSITDVVAAYDMARRKVGPNVPICASGQSAGGHLALLLAVRRPRLACTISEAGPAKLTPIMQTGGSATATEHARQMFSGPGGASYSPLPGLGRYQGGVLAGYADTDTVIPAAPQIAALKPLRNVQTMLLPGDPKGLQFVHTYVSAASMRAWQAAETRLLASVRTGRSARR